MTGRAGPTRFPSASRTTSSRRAARRDRPALSRLRRTARQRRFSAQRRPALPRHGPHRVFDARMPESAGRGLVRPCRRLAPANRPGEHGHRRSGLVRQEQHRPSHRRDFRLPRELPDETRRAIHAAGAVGAALVPGDAADFHRRRPRGPGQSRWRSNSTSIATISRSISRFRSAPITSSTTFTSGCNSTARSSTRATSRWPITANTAASTCSSAIRT